MSGDESILEQLPPEKLLDTRNARIITPAIDMMDEVATVERYLEYERANRDRPGINRYFTDRIDAIFGENDEIPPSSQGQESISPMSPPEELLAYIHDLGESDEKIGSSSGPDEL